MSDLITVRPDIVEAYQNGASFREIASRYGGHGSGWSFAFRLAGLETRAGGRRHDNPIFKFSLMTRTAICERYSAGEPGRRLATDYGMAVQTVYDLLRFHDIPVRGRGYRSSKSCNSAIA